MNRYLSFPFHADDDDGGDQEQGEGADDARVVGSVVDDLDAAGAQDVAQRFAESHRVQGHGHGVGHGEDDADGRSEFRTQRARYHIIGPTLTLIYKTS